MQGKISLRDALRVMAAKDTGGNFLPFSGKVITCDLREDTGGVTFEFKDAVLAGAPFGKKNTPKDANHYVNGTRNIMIPGRGRPVTIHNLLLTELNGEGILI